MIIICGCYHVCRIYMCKNYLLASFQRYKSLKELINFSFHTNFMKSFQLKESNNAVKLTLSILWKTHTAIPSCLNNYNLDVQSFMTSH